MSYLGGGGTLGACLEPLPAQGSKPIPREGIDTTARALYKTRLYFLGTWVVASQMDRVDSAGRRGGRISASVDRSGGCSSDHLAPTDPSAGGQGPEPQEITGLLPSHRQAGSSSSMGLPRSARLRTLRSGGGPITGTSGRDPRAMRACPEAAEDSRRQDQQQGAAPVSEPRH